MDIMEWKPIYELSNGFISGLLKQAIGKVAFDFDNMGNLHAIIEIEMVDTRNDLFVIHGTRVWWNAYGVVTSTPHNVTVRLEKGFPEDSVLFTEAHELLAVRVERTDFGHNFIVLNEIDKVLLRALGSIIKMDQAIIIALEARLQDEVG